MSACCQRFLLNLLTVFAIPLAQALLRTSCGLRRLPGFVRMLPGLKHRGFRKAAQDASPGLASIPRAVRTLIIEPIRKSVRQQIKGSGLRMTAQGTGSLLTPGV